MAADKKREEGQEGYVPLQTRTHPKISVVIPTRNRIDYLGRAIRSVLDQTEQDFEVIVVDDASDVDISASLQAFADRRIRLIRHGCARGGGAARNTGIRSAAGEYVAFLDDDDEWLPEKLELQLARLVRSDRPGMVFTGFFHIDERSGATVKVTSPAERGDLQEELRRRNVIGTTSTVMVQRSCLSDPFLFDEELRSCQDWDFYLRFNGSHPVEGISRPLVNYYIHEKSITKTYADSLQGHRAMLDKMMSRPDSSSAEIRYHYFKIGKLALEFGDVATARQELVKAMAAGSSAAFLPLLYLAASFLPREAYWQVSLLFNRLKHKWLALDAPHAYRRGNGDG